MEMLRIAAVKKRRISVIAPEGAIPGYLLGLDDNHLALYAQFHKRLENNEPVVTWAAMVVPRTLTVLVEERSLGDEAEADQEVYMSIGGREFLQECEKALRFSPNYSQEDSQ